MIVLASASPRRKELLKLITNDFIIHPSNIQEDIPSSISSHDVAQYLAAQKALDVAKEFPNDIVIGADTVIVYNDTIYGKPKDRNDAKDMLKTFSNSTHQVVTGVCVVNNSKSMSFSSISDVTFYKLSNEEIELYLDDDEYKDKAGAYAIQGKASLFIKEIKGDYNSIVGLPVAKLNQILKII